MVQQEESNLEKKKRRLSKDIDRQGRISTSIWVDARGYELFKRFSKQLHGKSANRRLIIFMDEENRKDLAYLQEIEHHKQKVNG
jgi:hypothetical protein